MTEDSTKVPDMTRYLVVFWKSDGRPDLVIDVQKHGTEWAMDETFKGVMKMYRVFYVEYATFTLYNQEHPEGISTQRWGLRWKNTAYSYVY